MNRTPEPHKRSPSKHVIVPLRQETTAPLTPPTTITKTQERNVKQEWIEPKKLLPELKKTSSAKRKPPLRYRPPKNSVFDARGYLDGVHAKTTDTKNAGFLKYALQNSRRIIIISGAGISVAAGIPDFRSGNGLFSTLRQDGVSSGKELFDINHVYSNDEMSLKFNRMIVDLFERSRDNQPTQFHRMMNWFAEEGRLRRLYTQNIDCLENKLTHLKTTIPLKSPFPTTIQLHGSINHMSCMKCSKIYQLDPVVFKCHEEQKNTQIVPLCAQCEEFDAVRAVAGMRSQGIGKLKPRIVLYNEIHPEGESIADIISKDLKGRPDCLIIVGTSLKIPGVRTMSKKFARQIHNSKGIVLWFNRELPSHSIRDFVEFIDLIVVGDCQDIPLILESEKIFEGI